MDTMQCGFFTSTYNTVWLFYFVDSLVNLDAILAV